MSQTECAAYNQIETLTIETKTMWSKMSSSCAVAANEKSYEKIIQTMRNAAHPIQNQTVT